MLRAVPFAILVFLFSACAALSETDDDTQPTEDLEEYTIPEDTIDISTPSGEYSEGRVYIHEVRKVDVDGVPGIVVKGSLPESCSRLKTAELFFESDDVVEIEMTSWRPADVSCAQVLVDFSYLFEDVDESRLATVTKYIHDGDEGEIISN